MMVPSASSSPSVAAMCSGVRPVFFSAAKISVTNRALFPRPRRKSVTTFLASTEVFPDGSFMIEILNGRRLLCLSDSPVGPQNDRPKQRFCSMDFVPKLLQYFFGDPVVGNIAEGYSVIGELAGGLKDSTI